MAESKEYSEYTINDCTATISPSLASQYPECRLYDDPLYDGSKWIFERRDCETGTVYIPLCAIQDERTVAALKTPGPLTAADDFFSETLRGIISRNKDHSIDPRDWYLEKMEVITGNVEGSGEQETEGELTRYPVKLTFEVSGSITPNSDYVCKVVRHLAETLIPPRWVQGRENVDP